eukprot:6919892-Lingulodinium_polyedra.AAC.1
MPEAVIAVANTKRAKGFVVKHPRLVPKHYKTVYTQDIMDALKFARKDRSFSLGNIILRRKDGWAMGGH